MAHIPGAHTKMLICWSHGTNSIEELKQAQIGQAINAIEADLGWNSVHEKAIMKHAVFSTEQDLKQECLAVDWLEFVYANSPAHIKILKLDFKSLLAVKSVVDWLVDKNDLDRFEIFLNADILPGPGASVEDAAPVDAQEFISQCARLPNATLSLGWTTKWSFYGETMYTSKHVDEMLQFISENHFPRTTKFTFPIRASFAWDSWPQLRRLITAQGNDNWTLTLWTGVEGVPQQELEWIEREYQQIVNAPRRLYVDCDKGPRHVRWHPARLLLLLANLEWKHVIFWC